MHYQTNYHLLGQQLFALIDSCNVPIAVLSNASALLNEALDDINWVGFYLCDSDSDELVLGPFQGKPACTVIKMGKGVCGTAAVSRKTVLVPDVHQFQGHIACDSASNAEIVIPMIYQDRLIGVLDIDSPVFNRFDQDDQVGLEAFCFEILHRTLWDKKMV